MALVALIRGLNVGGYRRLQPSALAAQLGHLNAVSIGAAGTIVVRRPVTHAQLRKEIGSRLPFETEIMICDGRDVLDLAARHPFRAQPQKTDVVHFASLLSRLPRAAPRLPLLLPEQGDKWVVRILARHGRFVLGMHRREMKAIRYLGELDRVFGSPATTRSWSTFAAIAKVLGASYTE